MPKWHSIVLHPVTMEKKYTLITLGFEIEHGIGFYLLQFLKTHLFIKYLWSPRTDWISFFFPSDLFFFSVKKCNLVLLGLIILCQARLCTSLYLFLRGAENCKNPCMQSTLISVFQVYFISLAAGMATKKHFTFTLILLIVHELLPSETVCMKIVAVRGAVAAGLIQKIRKILFQ